MLLNIALFSVSEFTVRANTTFRTQHIHLSSTACFCRFGHHLIDFTTYLEKTSEIEAWPSLLIH